MNGLKLRSLALFISIAMPSAYAATEFEDSIPAEVVTQVFGAMFGGQLRLYADVIDGFPPFEMPRDMTVLASVDQGYMQRVILKSGFDPQAATALAYGALLDSGWELIPTPGMQQPQTGFINPYQPVPQTQLCHAEHGMMQVSAQVGLGTTYVNLSRNITPPGVPAPGCAPAQARVVDPPMDNNPYLLLQQEMPRLVLPNTAGMTSNGGYGGGGGGPNEWETRAMLNGDWDIERVYEYFSEQIEDQDWDSDAEVIGEQMATGSWTRMAEDDVELVGSLTVLVTGDNAYDLRFRLIRKGGQPGFGFGGVMGNSGVIRDSAIRFVPGPAIGIRGIPAGAIEANGVRVIPAN